MQMKSFIMYGKQINMLFSGHGKILFIAGRQVHTMKVKCHTLASILPFQLNKKIHELVLSSRAGKDVP